MIVTNQLVNPGGESVLMQKLGNYTNVQWEDYSGPIVYMMGDSKIKKQIKNSKVTRLWLGWHLSA